MTIAFAGKGGTGKTTIAALLIRSLLRRSKGPLLAIDADPAANLHMALGLRQPITVGEIREEMSENAQSKSLGVGISRHEYLTHEIRMAVEEGEKIDLLAMGRPEGQGCYCAVNHLLRTIMDDLGKAYPYVVIDNEAGMEHLSRRTTRDVDLLYLVTDPTLRGVHTASEMAQLAQELEINVHQVKLLINRVAGDLPEPLQEAVVSVDIPLAGMIPADPKINELDALGEPLVRLEEDSPAAQAVAELAQQVLDER